jgi:hypothetical protein
MIDVENDELCSWINETLEKKEKGHQHPSLLMLFKHVEKKLNIVKIKKVYGRKSVREKEIDR